MTGTRTPRTVAQAIEDAASSASAGFRFVDEGSDVERFVPFRDVERESARFGGALQALGARKGERVALILPDNSDFVFAFLGAIRAGIVPVPIYPPTGVGKLAGYLGNTLHIVERSGAKLLLTNARIKRVLGTLQVRAPALERVVPVESLRSVQEPLRPAQVSLDETCLLQFTSGSTSRPKGVVLTHANLAANVRIIMQLGLGVRDGEDVGVSWLPLYHDMGLIGFVIAPIYHASPIVFLPPLLFLKRPARWLEAISRHRGSVSFGPNFAYALCAKRIRDAEVAGLDLSSWRIAGCGAEPIRADSLRAFARAFAPIGFSEKAFVSCYGMAESTLAISFSRLGEGVVTDHVDARALASAGKAEPVAAGREDAVAVVQCGAPFEGHDVRVFAPDDAESARPLPERTVGELRLRGPSVMGGYHDDPELTREAFAGGWLRTGDLGYLAGGNVHVCGRTKELIIVNGRNYYPQDIEWEATKVQGVRKGNVIAFGTSSADRDSEGVVIAFETTLAESEREAQKREVRRVVQQAVGISVDDLVALDAGTLPKTSSGKPQRAKTRELYESGALLGRSARRGFDPLDAARELARSQIGYLRHAVLGKRREA